jgi:hypothetical protein
MPSAKPRYQAQRRSWYSHPGECGDTGKKSVATRTQASRIYVVRYEPQESYKERLNFKRLKRFARKKFVQIESLLDQSLLKEITVQGF